jgi:6-phosphogluconolactonase
VALFLLGAATNLRAADKPDSQPTKYWAYIGTYSQRGSEGIYRFDYDSNTGKLTGRILAAKVKDPSFLAIHPSHDFLFSVNEVADFKGKSSGALSAFVIDRDTGKLTLLNQQPSNGGNPCHLVVDKRGRHVLAANYGGGSAIVLPIERKLRTRLPRARLGLFTAFQQHHGKSVDKGRQEGPHAHSINLDPTNRFAFVADLGLDKVMVYRYDANKGSLEPNDPPSASVAPGSGPRHFAFHPKGKHAYVINEMKSTVTAFDYDAEKGALKAIQTISTLPEGFKKPTSTAEVQVHPSGKFLYGSNRGHDSITVFAIDGKTGKLTRVGWQAEGIKTPRNFAIDPTGKWLLVANQDSDSIVVFRFDQKTGELKPTGEKVKVPMPVCIKMMAKPPELPELKD